MTAYRDAITGFAQVLCDAAAEQAWYPGHPLTVEEIAAQLEALHGKRQAA
jgi:hypothetical protein